MSRFLNDEGSCRYLGKMYCTYVMCCRSQGPIVLELIYYLQN